MKDLKNKYAITIETHNMRRALMVSDYTAFMYIGKFVEFEDTSSMFKNQVQGFTAEYLSGKFG